MGRRLESGIYWDLPKKFTTAGKPAAKKAGFLQPFVEYKIDDLEQLSP